MEKVSKGGFRKGRGNREMSPTEKEEPWSDTRQIVKTRNKKGGPQFDREIYRVFCCFRSKGKPLSCFLGEAERGIRPC